MVFTPLNIFLDWNPQFFREVKGRLTRRNTIIAVSASVGTQMLLMMGFSSVLPEVYATANRYCTKVSANYYEPHCVLDAFGNAVINWPLWWLHVFQTLSWIMALVGVAAGVYLLMDDLAQEEQRGTLNFIRLSPQPSRNVLLGKLLGVPILAYLAIAIAIPLHLYAGTLSGLSDALLVSLYLGFLVLCGACFVGGLLLVSLGLRQAWAGLIGVAVGSMYAYLIWRDMLYKEIYLPLREWFLVDIGASLVHSTLWWVVSLSVATYWLWVALNRRFRNPSALLISKRQSYVLTAMFEIWVLGWMTQSIEEWHDPLSNVALFMLVNIFWFIVLAAAITPSRQTLLDWVRYRRVHRATASRSRLAYLFVDLVNNDKSPATLTLALNLAIAVGGLAMWLLRWPGWSDYSLAILGTMVLSAVFMLTCTLIAQFIVFSQVQSRFGLAWITVMGLIFLPPLVFVLGSAFPEDVPVLWLCSAFGLAAIEAVSVSAFVMASLAQLGALLVFSTRLSIQLQKAGESDFKALSATNDAQPKLIY